MVRIVYHHLSDQRSFFDYSCLMFIAENEPHEGKRVAESTWPIFRIHHQRSRYIYDLFYRQKEISRELYDFCLREGYADANLIAKWKKVRSLNLRSSNQDYSQDTKSYVVFDAYKQEIITLRQHVFAEFQKRNLNLEKL